jgi:hypothetical protein
MGREQRIGNFPAGLVWLAGGSGPESEEIFAGIDTALAAIAALVPDETAAARIDELLRSVELDAAALRDELSLTSLAAAVEPLASMLSRLRQAEDLARQSGAGAAAELVGEKQEHLEAALAAAAGVVVDTSCDRETLTPGEAGTVELSVWPAGEVSVTVRDVQLASAAGWTVTVPERLGVDERSGVEQWRARVALPVETRPTQPYYLERVLVGDLYDWSEVPPELRGQPFQPGPLTAVFDLEVGGADVRLVKEVVHRYGDQAVGEIRRPLRAVPPLEVEVARDLVLWPRERTEPVALEVVLRSSVAAPVAGALDLDLPPGWRVRGERSFEIAEPRGSLVVTLELEPEDVATEGRSLVAIGAVLDDGTESRASFPVIEYSHIAPRAVRRDASVELSAFDLDLPTNLRLGYVLGASDRVPGVLAQVGLVPTMLSAADLARGDLDGFDVIVVGSRAYETDVALGRANRRLVDFVRRGGTLVVQYQQYQFVEGAYAPAPLSIARPHGRVTDETAPVEVLVPGHRVFSWPNRIGPEDWRGWVQERGLYFASEWDELFSPLLVLADPGREPERGALLVAELGEGTYVYTGLSFFRQLPAGVAGAIRLFVNLVSLEEDR